MKILSWNISISAHPIPHWAIQIKTGNGENHIAEMTREGLKFNEKHNRAQGSIVDRNGGASSRTWGELQAFMSDYKKKNQHYDLLSNNCIQLTNAVAAFLG
jgi:hypothetical protein